MTTRILVADIGGTNSRFSLFEISDSESKDLLQVGSIWLRTSDSGSLGELFSALKISDQGGSSFFLNIHAVCVAAAGPVTGGRYCKPPNINWSIDIEDIKPFFKGAPIFLINDFLAQAYACAGKIAENALCVKPGVRLPGTVAVIGPGTGLGKAILVKHSDIHDSVNDRTYIGVPSEGGHASFPVETFEEFGYLQFLQNKLGSKSVSFEHVLSGRGLSYLYEYFNSEVLPPEDVARLILNNTESKEVKPVLSFYRRSLGRACKCFALESFSSGGVFITGGVIAKNPILAKGPDFIDSFSNSDTQKAFLDLVPIFLVDNQESGLWGAAEYTLFSLQQLSLKNA
ncbi:MAG TPA: glucokinase [Oligoflexia bacterium]|nr:glucokinase [Oligoflexia bacterium]HMP47995.1 glucokinase [Oligoflexia bacterium]